MSAHDDYEIEPIPGLPERPPLGEEVLWQGVDGALRKATVPRIILLRS